MDIPSISQTLAENTAANAANASSTGKDALGNLSDTYDNFLTLLTKQLQNQDPLSPMDTSEFTQQLVAFSNVEQQIQSNKNLEKLITLQSATNAYSAVSFIGTSVAIDSDKVMLQDKNARFDYTIDKTATKATLTIRDKNNQVVMITEADGSVGTHPAQWDGTDVFGNQLADGQYSVSVSYEDITGKQYTADITSYGVVDSADIEDGAVYLNVGTIRVPLDKVQHITKPVGDA
jgi:flagellar basal-body rod modification protein FlgD